MSQDDLDARLRDALVSPNLAAFPFILDGFRPGQPPSIHSLALGSLARLVVPSRNAPHAVPTPAQLAKPIDSLLEGTSLPDWTVALSVLGSIIQLSPELASAILDSSSIQPRLLEGVDILLALASSPSRRHENIEAIADAKLALAKFVSAAAGQSKTRSLARQVASRESWLEKATVDEGASKELRATAAVGAIKLALGKDEEDSQLVGSSAKKHTSPDLSRYVDLLSGLLDGNGGRGDAAVVEGLAILALQSPLKDSIANPTLLKTLYSLVPTDSTELQYGLSSLFSSLASYAPKLSGADAAKERLYRMANPASPSDAEPDERVDARIDRLLSSGVFNPLVILGRSTSLSVRRAVSRTVLSLVEKVPRRGRILQAGGARVLLGIIAETPAPSPEPDPADLVSIQALSKLLITTNPALIFNQPQLLRSLPKPLALPLLHPNSSNPLQQFESLMALTNLASVDGTELKDTIAVTEGLLDRVQDTMLESTANGMLRRAGTEVVCNTVASEKGFEWLAGDGALDPERQNEPADGRIKTRSVILGLAILLPFFRGGEVWTPEIC
jgi:hypothetical protein